MKKTIIALAAVAAGFASCSSEDVAENSVAQEAQAIALDAYAGGQSRGSIIASDGANGYQFNLYGFDLYANVHEGTSTQTKPFMNNQHVDYNATEGKWVYAPIKYWPTEAGSTVDFYPRWNGIPGTADETNIQTIYDWNNIPQVTFYVNDKVADQTDYIWASPILGAKRQDYVGTTVDFQFKHALSALEFSLKLDGLTSDELDVTRIAVNSVKVTGYFAPKANLIPSETDVTKIWNLQGDWEPRSYTISDPVEEILAGKSADRYTTGSYKKITRSGANPVDAAAQAADPENYTGGYRKGTMFVLPYKAGDYEIEMTYTIYTWETAADKGDMSLATAETYTVKKTVTGVTFEPGKLYDHQITLTLQPISVGASFVDWTVETVAVTMP